MRRTDQKFQAGDLVRIADNIPWIMGTSEDGPYVVAYKGGSGKRAIVFGSYKDQYGGDNNRDYTIAIEGYGKTSWYSEADLSLIEENRHDLYHKWR